MPVNEPLLRKILLAIAVLGLAAGFATHFQLGMENLADSIWAFASAPVIAALALSIGRDLWAGRFGVDAIALVSMSAALWLGEDLAAIVVAIMYMGGNVLEDYARGRAQSDLKALTDRSPRIAHRRRGEVLELSLIHI